MPDHALLQIREAMYTRLEADPQIGIVYKGRRSPYSESTRFPVVNIAAINENVDRFTVENYLMREGSMTLEVLAKSVDDCEPILFEQQRLIERAIASDNTFGGLVLDFVLSSSRQEERENDEVEFLFEKRILNFDFKYVTAEGVPEVVVNTLGA